MNSIKEEVTSKFRILIIIRIVNMFRIAFGNWQFCPNRMILNFAPTLNLALVHYSIQWGGVVNIETFILLEVKLQLQRHYIPQKLTFGARFYILHLRLYFLA